MAERVVSQKPEAEDLDAGDPALSRALKDWAAVEEQEVARVQPELGAVTAPPGFLAKVMERVEAEDLDAGDPALSRALKDWAAVEEQEVARVQPELGAVTAPPGFLAKVMERVEAEDLDAGDPALSRALKDWAAARRLGQSHVMEEENNEGQVGTIAGGDTGTVRRS